MRSNQVIDRHIAAGIVEDALNWRYATGRFDSASRLSEEDLLPILRSIQMAPTANGLQPFHAHLVSDERMKIELQKAAYNQPQVGSCSHVIVFVARADIRENAGKLITDAEQKGTPQDKVDLMRKYIKLADFIRSMTFSRHAWASEQAHIALGFALLTAAQLRIDACPMGGFSARKVGRVLGLGKGFRPSVLLALGRRADEDTQRAKYRLPLDELITRI